MTGSAVFSEDQKSRFELIRDWSDELTAGQLQTVNFVMLNPSTADAIHDDQTVRKVVGFARRWRFNRVVVTNLIADISTDPWLLPYWSGIDMRNRSHLQEWMGSADLVVVAWGSQPMAVRRKIALSEHILLLKRTASVDLYCIGITKGGDPLHPSRCSYTSEPVLWRSAEAITHPEVETAKTGPSGAREEVSGG